jgi:signal recognition particle subunit SRP54
LHDVVILDTAGRLHIDEALMTELQEVHTQVSKPHGVLLVCDAMLGQDAVNSAKEFHARLPLGRDPDQGRRRRPRRRGAVDRQGDRPADPVRRRRREADDLEEFDPSRMAGRILGMGDVVGLVEKAQSVIDEKEAEKAAKKLQKGQFNFEDFLARST